MNDTSLEPVTVTVPVAIQLSGLGRTKLYELLGRKQVDSITVGTRRLVNYASLKAFLSTRVG